MQKFVLLLGRNISKLTDEELLFQFKKSGRNEYFGELYNRYIPLLYGFCLKYLQHPEKAEDAVMQLFEDLLLKINTYEIDTFRTWIYTVVRNHCLQILRKENRETIVRLEVEFMESDEVLHLLEDENEDNEQKDALKNCLEKLPEKQQTCIHCFFMDEMSYIDISEQTGFPPNKVKSYIQNGKRNLKLCMEKQKE